ncbi:MAG: DEAD/DEAH box helicase family protein [Treponema sp.]|nr:DEAD/DEAH box helicase family protein [Treponema sp.]
MAKKKTKQSKIVDYNEQFAFYEQLWYFYQEKKGIIKRNYKVLTRAFLNYNDKSERKEAYLHTPQFEALEMYIFIKEFFKNKQVIEIFELWVKEEGDFSGRGYYKDGQHQLWDSYTKEQTEILFKQMEKYKTEYPNYIFALTMGLGKSRLMATCIYYEFLLANKHPKEPIYCYNALIFAPDKTVLQTLATEIREFDKTLVVPPEYAHILDTNIKIQFLEDTNTTINTIDNSMMNIIITNNQKIIVKKSHKEKSAAQKLFQDAPKQLKLLSGIYDDEEIIYDENMLEPNKRFQKLCRLPQLGVYIDEAHHLFGAKLMDDLASDKTTSFRTTINLLSQKLKKNKTEVVGCYNFTGTPYVEQQVLPEVVYAFGLKDAIREEYLKEVNIKGFGIKKDIEFLRAIVDGYTDTNGKKVQGFLDIYKGRTFEGLLPKIAIFTNTVDEIRKVVKPQLEKLLAERGIDIKTILVNVGDGNSDLTGNDEIRLFNQLDVPDSEGNKKQFILLCGKGKEGWNCRSLFGVALYRNTHSKVFVLQSTMRCMRKIRADNEPPKQETATVYLYQENYDVLEAELNKSFNMSIKDLSNANKKRSLLVKVKMMPPERPIKVKEKRVKYNISKNDNIQPIDFGIDKIDVSKYQITVIEKTSLANSNKGKSEIAVDIADNKQFTEYMLIFEIAKYFPLTGALKIEEILRTSFSGIENVLNIVNKYNQFLYDEIIPRIFAEIYTIDREITEEEREIILLKTPPDGGNDYYEFYADPALLAHVESIEYAKYKDISFHASHYVFDSKPELECFIRFLQSKDVKNVYFTGMFTDRKKTDFAVGYTDPVSNNYRNYYPDFLVQMKDGSYQIIEVKGDNLIDNETVLAKQAAAQGLTADSNMIYRLIAGSDANNPNIVNPNYESKVVKFPFVYKGTTDGYGMGMAADSAEKNADK